jgi:hypothetical protein
MEALMKVHVICPQESFPDIIFLTVQQMGDHRKANLCAVSSEEDVFVKKKHKLPILHLNGA